MILIFSDSPIPQDITKSIFLAGPSPRDNTVYDWRHDALAYLSSINFDGTVFIPIPHDRFYGTNTDKAGWTYDGQIDWECKCRNISDLIIFWIPRKIDRERKDLGMPAFTSNVEFGEDLHSGKIVYGRPYDAEKCTYLDKRIKEINQPIFDNLPQLLEHAVLELGSGAYRSKGEVNVPLFIWKSEQFQSWYSNLKQAGNRLEEAKLLYHVKFSNQHVFCYVLSVNIWVEAEQRYKHNEFVFARKDISSVVAYYQAEDEIKIALVKEFRSPVNNSEGFVYELPGGSSSKPNTDPRENAQHEMEEEVGLIITDLSRFHYVGQRQLAATLSSHQSQVYAIELTQKEYQQILHYAANKRTFGIQNESEITYVDMIGISQLKESFFDFSMLGMIFQAIYLNKQLLK